MNRLTNYLKSKELAKICLIQSSEYLAKNNHSKALQNLILAVKEILTAQNCLVSLAFQKRKMIGKRIKKSAIVF